MGEVRRRWMEEPNPSGHGTRMVEWRQIPVDPSYEINSEGVLRRINNGRILKDQKEFRYFDGSVRRSISIRKLRNRAWAELDPS